MIERRVYSAGELAAEKAVLDESGIKYSLADGGHGLTVMRLEVDSLDEYLRRTASAKYRVRYGREGPSEPDRVLEAWTEVREIRRRFNQLRDRLAPKGGKDDLIELKMSRKLARKIIDMLEGSAGE